MGDSELTLRESADLLGVHYMTVYRYVRLGLLAGDKVQGTWRVRRPDLLEFQAATGPVTPGQVTPGRRRAPWADRLEARLVAGDARGSWGVVEASLASGSKLEDVYLDLLTPAMRSIGARWAAGELDVSVEHRASVIAIRLIGRLGPRFTRRGRSRGAVIIGAPAGEQHSLSLAMLADILRQQGWDVSDLGSDVPASGFVHMLNITDGVVAVGLSVTSERSLQSAAEAVQAIRFVSPTTPVLVGGDAVADADHARRLGADHFTGDARTMGVILDLIAAPARVED